MAGLFVTLGCIFSLSASVEVRCIHAAVPCASQLRLSNILHVRLLCTRVAQRRPNPPVRPIPSEAWSKWAIVDRANGEARKTW